MALMSAAKRYRLENILGRAVDIREAGDLAHMESGHRKQIVQATINSLDELRAVMRWAGDESIRVVPIGSGHSCRVPSASREFLLVKPQIDPAVEFVSPGVAGVGAAATWADVESSLRVGGWEAPVTSDYLGLTVGGTVSRGGYGINSVLRGMQADHVIALDIMTADGNLVRCAEGHPLFDCAVAGVLSVGVLVRVYLSVAPRTHRLYLYTYDIDEMAAFPQCASNALASHGDDVVSMDLTWFPRSRGMSFRVGLAQAASKRAADFTHSAAKLVDSTCEQDYRMRLSRHVEAWYTPFRSRGKVWADFVIPEEAAAEFGATVDNFCARTDYLSMLECGYAVPVARLSNGPRVLFSAAEKPGQRYVLFGLYFMPIDDPVSRDMLVKSVWETLLPVCARLGGRPYQHSLPELSHEEYENIYGHNYRVALDVMKKFDPGMVLWDTDAQGRLG